MSAARQACPATNIGLLRQARDRLDLNRQMGRYAGGHRPFICASRRFALCRVMRQVQRCFIAAGSKPLSKGPTGMAEADQQNDLLGTFLERESFAVPGNVELSVEDVRRKVGTERGQHCRSRVVFVTGFRLRTASCALAIDQLLLHSVPVSGPAFFYQSAANRATLEFLCGSPGRTAQDWHEFSDRGPWIEPIIFVT